MKGKPASVIFVFDVPIQITRFVTRTHVFSAFVWATRRFTRSQVNIWYICVRDTPIHQVTSQLFAHLCWRHAGSLGHKSTFCTFVWATRRFTRSHVNILYICVGDTPVHQVTSEHLVHLCKRHAVSQSHKSTFGTRAWATRRSTRSHVNI